MSDASTDTIVRIYATVLGPLWTGWHLYAQLQVFTSTEAALPTATFIYWKGGILLHLQLINHPFPPLLLDYTNSRMGIPYSRKYWRSIKFGGLAVGETTVKFKSVKFKYNLRVCVRAYCMYRTTAKFKSANILLTPEIAYLRMSCFNFCYHYNGNGSKLRSIYDEQIEDLTHKPILG